MQEILRIAVLAPACLPEYADAVGFVVHIRNAFDFLVVRQISDALDQLSLVHTLRNLGSRLAFHALRHHDFAAEGQTRTAIRIRKR